MVRFKGINSGKVLYEKSSDDKYRYVLGNIIDENGRTLVCLGINPSTATPESLDKTVDNVRRICTNNGYSNWVMINVYPFRSTDPSKLPEIPLAEEMERNKAEIQKVIEKYDCDILMAYGNPINTRYWLHKCLDDIFEIFIRLKPDIAFKYLEFTKLRNPSHPSRKGNKNTLKDAEITYRIKEK